MKHKLLDFIKKLLPHLLIVILFLILTVAYFSPAFEGKVLQQSDVLTAQGAQHQTKELLEKTGHYSLWTNSMFGGMPTYTIMLKEPTNIFKLIKKVFAFLPYYDARIFFIYLLGFYLLLLAFGVNKWVSAVFSTAYALASYNIIIIAVGHITKAYALGFMPMVIASFVLIYQKRQYLWGGIALVISLGLMLDTHHFQIVYYTAMLAGLYVLYNLIADWAEKKGLKHFAIATAVAVVASLFAVLPNTVNIWTFYENTKHSIRGGHSDLVEGNQKKVKGLDKEYALAWSYGVGESLSLLIPDIKGGESDYIGNDTKLMAKINSQYKQYLAQQSRYWGPQPFTAGPVYFGAIVMFLFVLGFFIVKNKIKWWILAATLLSIMLAWGKHFMLLTDLFYYYFPLYNKFRVVSMILVVAQLTVPLFAAMTVYEIIKDPEVVKKNIKGFFIAFGLTGGVALLVYLFPKIAGPLLSPQEAEFLKNIASTQGAQVAKAYQEFFAELESVRAMIVKADAIRSFVFISLAALLVLGYSYMKERNQFVLLGGLTLLILFDMWTVDRRYLSYNDYKPKRVVRNQWQPSPADKFIMKTNAKDFRVLNLTVNPFADATTSYYHQSVGGYSAVKLRRYQDVIDNYLAPYSNMLIQALRDTTGTVDVMTVLKPMQVLHMLNTLYIIVNPNSMPIVNPYAFGNAWFVDGFKFVDSPKEEFDALSQVDLRRYAVINRKKYQDVKFPELSLLADTSRRIELVYYQPDSLVYKSFSRNTEFAVFSEIYYPEGWQAYIDGKPVQIINTDYILRGIIVPPGEHTIVMVFKPKSYYLGKKIALAGSILLVLLVISALVYTFVKSKNKTVNTQEQ